MAPRTFAVRVSLGLLVLAAAACGGGGSVSAPTPLGPVPITAAGTGVTTYTYTNDVRSILSDCTPCHNSSQRQSGFDFSSYSGVMQAVTPGSDQSLLVQVTQPQGIMYTAFTGDRTQKAGVIYDWVVNSKAAQ